MISALQGLAHWHLDGVIDEGDHATIYRARPVSCGADEPHSALKVLRSACLSDEVEVEAFQSRARWSREIGLEAVDKRLVCVSEYGDAEGTPWMAMPAIDGLPISALGTKRAPGRISPEAGVLVAQELLEVLVHLQSLSEPMSHGRISPNHILVDEDAEIRVVGVGGQEHPRHDLLALGRLLEQAVAEWPSEMDAWIDQLKSDDDAFDDAAEALESIPYAAFDDDVLEQGRVALRRSVKRTRRRRAKEVAKLEAEASALAAPEPLVAPELGELALDTALVDEEDGYVDDEQTWLAVDQAQPIFWSCMALVVLALAIEIVTHTP